MKQLTIMFPTHDLRVLVDMLLLLLMMMMMTMTMTLY